MRSEGYSTWVCVSVCLSVKSHLTYGASVRPENAVTYSAGNEGQNICGVFPENAPLLRSSGAAVVFHTFGWPFFFIAKVVRMRIDIRSYACGNTQFAQRSSTSFSLALRWPISAFRRKADRTGADRFRTEAERLRCRSELSDVERRVSVSGASPP